MASWTAGEEEPEPPPTAPRCDDPPTSWVPQSHPVQLFDVHDPNELAEVTRIFYQSLDKLRDGVINIGRLQRIQNKPLWQEYSEYDTFHHHHHHHYHHCRPMTEKNDRTATTTPWTTITNATTATTTTQLRQGTGLR